MSRLEFTERNESMTAIEYALIQAREYLMQIMETGRLSNMDELQHFRKIMQTTIIPRIEDDIAEAREVIGDDVSVSVDSTPTSEYESDASFTPSDNENDDGRSDDEESDNGTYDN